MTQEKYAFRMKLNPGMKAEYIRRHDEIWPELVVLLKATILPDATAASGVVKQLTDQMQEIRARDLVGR